MCENVDDGGLRRSEPTPEVEELEQIDDALVRSPIRRRLLSGEHPITYQFCSSLVCRLGRFWLFKLMLCAWPFDNEGWSYAIVSQICLARMMMKAFDRSSFKIHGFAQGISYAKPHT